MTAGAAQKDITPKPREHRTLEKNSLELQNWRAAIDPLFAKALVQAHEGTIEVESTLGQGTSFTIGLPQARFG